MDEYIVIIGLLIPFAGTCLGSSLALFMKKELGEKTQKLLLGFTAGIMVAASIWSLLIPAIDMSTGGKVGSSFSWIFNRNIFLTITRSYNSSFTYRKNRGRRTEDQT